MLVKAQLEVASPWDLDLICLRKYSVEHTASTLVVASRYAFSEIFSTNTSAVKNSNMYAIFEKRRFLAKQLKIKNRKLDLPFYFFCVCVKTAVLKYSQT